MAGATLYYNVTGSTGVSVELIKPGGNTPALSSVLITNIHSSSAATVSLFIQDDPEEGTTKTFHIIKEHVIPVASSFIVDNDYGILNNDWEQFGLYITVGGSDTVDVLMNRK